MNPKNTIDTPSQLMVFSNLKIMTKFIYVFFYFLFFLEMPFWRYHLPTNALPELMEIVGKLLWIGFTVFWL